VRKILTTKTPVTFTSIAINNSCHRWLGQVDRERVKKKIRKTGCSRQEIFLTGEEF